MNKYINGVDLFDIVVTGNWEKECDQITERYMEQCVDEKTYDDAGLQLRHQAENYGLSWEHLAKRGRYTEYSERVTHPEDERFICCHACCKQFCTDPWQPFSYSSAWNRILWVRNEKVYHCVQKEACRQRQKEREELLKFQNRQL